MSKVLGRQPSGDAPACIACRAEQVHNTCTLRGQSSTHTVEEIRLSGKVTMPMGVVG